MTTWHTLLMQRSASVGARVDVPARDLRRGRRGRPLVYRHENGEARFPSLYTIGRQPRRSRRPDVGDGSEGGEIPGDDEGGDIGTPVSSAP